MVDMEKIVPLSKRRGFIFHSSEGDSGDRGLSWNYAAWILGRDVKRATKGGGAHVVKCQK